MDEILSKFYALTPKQRKTVSEKFLDILNENEETRKKTGKKTTAKFKKVTKVETERDTMLYNRLRAWRNKTAEAAGLDVKSEAWQIMKNDPLINVAYYKPTNEEEFLRVDGMTSDYFTNYGEEIIAIVTGKNISVSAPSKKTKVVAESTDEGEDPIEEEVEGEDADFKPPAKLKWFL